MKKTRVQVKLNLLTFDIKTFDRDQSPVIQFLFKSELDKLYTEYNLNTVNPRNQISVKYCLNSLLFLCKQSLLEINYDNKIFD